MSSSIHTSVLPAEVMAFLAVKPGMRLVDGTLGGGGHTRLLAEAVGPDGLVIAIDRDPLAIERGARELAGLPVRFAQANYCDVPEVLDAVSIDAVDGVLLDVGLINDDATPVGSVFHRTTTGCRSTSPPSDGRVTPIRSFCLGPNASASAGRTVTASGCTTRTVTLPQSTASPWPPTSP